MFLSLSGGYNVIMFHDFTEIFKLLHLVLMFLLLLRKYSF